MPKSKRYITFVALMVAGVRRLLLSGVGFEGTRWSTWPLICVAERGARLFACLPVVHDRLVLTNGMLTSEFVRKTQLEADQIAARQIQQTLHPQKLEELQGYQVETVYQAYS